MKVELVGSTHSEIFVRWEYTHGDGTRKNKTVTKCFVFNKENELLCTGITYLRPGDVFEKAEGRKQSLTKALYFFESKIDRAQIWSVFKEQTNTKFKWN